MMLSAAGGLYDRHPAFVNFPMLSFMDPLTSLNFGTFICAKERIKTKKAIKNVAISAKVAIQAWCCLLCKAGSHPRGLPLPLLGLARDRSIAGLLWESFRGITGSQRRAPSGASAGPVTSFSS